MRIAVAGKDRTGDLGRSIAEEAGRLKSAGPVGRFAPEHSAVVLKESAGAADYQRRFIDLLRMRQGVRTSDYYVPRAPGLRGRASAAAKTLLWKLLRYQHDRISFQQNLINELAIDALEFQQGPMEQEWADLKRRVESLEEGRAKGAPP
ncbi:MAG: hypothetical protein AB7V14_08935 [Kiritimatiellia bacterium]